MINMDFGQRIIVDSETIEWSASPKSGVWRKRFAREEAEQGHATSVVWFEAGSEFNQHEHPKGEEIFVLEGVFSDHTGDYHAGSYLRNPEGFTHSPFSTNGCKLFVKLCQFQPDDDSHITLANLYQRDDAISTLHQHKGERTQIIRLHKGQSHKLEPFLAFEMFVLKGSVAIDNDQQDQLGKHCWLRSPRPTGTITATKDAELLIKQGHFSG